jgi:hypothetical protein
MRSIVWLAVVAAAGCLTAPAQRVFTPTAANVRELPAKDKRWALLVGVDNYVDENITDLKGAANDVRALKEVLVKYAGFPEDQIIVLATGEAGREPTRPNILQKLSNVLALTPRDGLFLFAFSGHGIQRERQPYLLPAEASYTDDLQLLEDLSISVNRVRQAIVKRQIQQVVVILDACRNDPGGRDAGSVNPLTEEFTRGFRFDLKNREVAAFATLFATEVGERAWEDLSRRRGFFSLALEEALSGKAANEKGEVTLGAALAYAQRAVPKRVQLEYGVNRRQLPFAQVDGYLANDLVLSVVKPEFVPPPPPAPVVNPVKPVPSRGAKKKGPDGLTYLWIPAGIFRMGCSPGDDECWEDKEPPVSVTLTKGFWMGDTEVTQEAYQRMMGATQASSRIR